MQATPIDAKQGSLFLVLGTIMQLGYGLVQTLCTVRTTRSTPPFSQNAQATSNLQQPDAKISAVLHGARALPSNTKLVLVWIFSCFLAAWPFVDCLRTWKMYQTSPTPPTLCTTQPFTYPLLTLPTNSFGKHIVPHLSARQNGAVPQPGRMGLPGCTPFLCPGQPRCYPWYAHLCADLYCTTTLMNLSQTHEKQVHTA